MPSSPIIEDPPSPPPVTSVNGKGPGAVVLASTDLTDGAILAHLNSPAFTGAPTTATPAASDNSTKLASTAYVDRAVSVIDGGHSA